MTGFVSLSRALLRGYFRDTVSLFFTIAFPLMFLVLFAALFSDTDVGTSKLIQVGDVAALDAMKSDAPDEYADLFEVTPSGDLDAAIERVRQGDADAVVRQSGDKVYVYYSEADRTRSAIVQNALSGVVNAENLYRLSAAAPDVPLTSVDTEQVENRSLTTIQYLTPGLLGWAVSISGVFGAASTLVDWRRNKILRRLRLSPVSVPAVIGARVGVSMTVAMLQLAIFIGVASLPFFGLQLTGAWWMAVPILLVGTLAFLAMGMVVGGIARTGEGASGLSNLIVMPMAFASGTFFPLDQAPQWLRNISYVSPLRYINESLLSVMVRGNSPLSVLPELGLMLLFTLVVGLIAWRVFSWDDL